MMPEPPQTKEVWDQFGQTLRGYFARRLADTHAADDLTQETMLRVQRGLAGLVDASQLGPWVMRIARHVLIDHLRQLKRHPTPQSLEHEPASTSKEDLQEDDQAIGQCLSAMTKCLPDAARQLLGRIDIEGMSQAEYARREGLSPSGAKSRVQRARQQLKQELFACCEFELNYAGRPVTFKHNSSCSSQCGCDNTDTPKND